MTSRICRFVLSKTGADWASGIEKSVRNAQQARLRGKKSFIKINLAFTMAGVKDGKIWGVKFSDRLASGPPVLRLCVTANVIGKNDGEGLLKSRL